MAGWHKCRLLLPVWQQRGVPVRAISGVVLRDTGRLGLIAVAEVMLMITGEIDLSVSSTLSLAPYVRPFLRYPERWPPAKFLRFTFQNE
jgi:hypothetical protein